MVSNVSNSDFDINILEDWEHPNIDLTFPLPTDKKTYVQLEGNEQEVGSSFALLNNFFHYFTNIDFDDIYKNNEYKYAINKFSPTFTKKMVDHMNDKLEHSDKQLDELVSGLINTELNLKLIKPEDYNTRFIQAKAFVVKYYKQQNETNLPTFKSRNTMRIAYVTILKLFQKMFPQGVWCSKQEFSDMYARYLKDPMSIIFLPNHQSHIDYIIIHLFAVRFQFAVPSVISGDNLNVAFFGRILKNVGAIFIPRSMNNELYTERNLSNAIEFFLLNHVHLEVFIEGTRSRDGKVLLPKYGILKTLAKVFLKQRLEDKNATFNMQIQPMSITYERVYETDGYLKELIGRDKKQESFLNIVRAGAKNLFGKPDDRDDIVYDKDGFSNTKEKQLSGKIFVKLGEAFTMSSFIEQEGGKAAAAIAPAAKSKLWDDAPLSSDTLIDTVNLKKLGFKVMHEINRVSFLPEAAIVGTAIYIHAQLTRTKTFSITSLLPVMRFVVDTLARESQDHSSNRRLLKNLQEFTDDELTQVIKLQILYFFKFISVNKHTDTIRIEHIIELLYYKNLGIHLIIDRCKAAFILLMSDAAHGRNPTFLLLNKLNYILTGFMKNEFLFDYNYNPRSDLEFILGDFEKLNIIRFVPDQAYYEILDRQYLETFGNLVRPFLESYVKLTTYTLGMLEIKKSRFATEAPKHKADKHFDYDELRYPTTKTLLKYITTEHQKHPDPTSSSESVNKQYLLSNLYYFNNLRLIRIFKNKAKTKAFVQVLNSRDLHVLVSFLTKCLNNDSQLLNDDVGINYVIDVIDKNPDREAPQAKL